MMFLNKARAEFFDSAIPIHLPVYCLGHNFSIGLCFPLF